MMQIGKIFMILGIIFILFGVGIYLFSYFKIPFLGKLPGDIFIQKKNFTFYFPITTSIFLSIILSLLFYLAGRFLK
ncbi:MAG: DUF2905 domain-containing protein [Candidatus Omnitrophica bacterium]|nr:DUF2905 domain-containing protein [Candidatus Omnitrophota bacterium]MCM8831259.1 DUF2905 domain-containing protein [Candidatus Omnitrophota bacterium]